MLENCRRQQEILRLRQNPQATQKYFQEVNKRRQTVSDNGEGTREPVHFKAGLCRG